SGVEKILDTDRASLHWYGKREVYALRKMGHVTLVGDEMPVEALHDQVRELSGSVSFQPG
ncbi:MAG: 5-(carboxyamino)imidazole ribonucleotide synthase, partial [Salinirussus sp.]